MAAAKKVAKKPEKEKPKVGRCYDCANAYLMRSEPHNPIVALCNITKERWVASMEPECRRFSRRIGEPEINPMIFLNR